MVLIGLRISILRLSRLGPPAARTASAMSAGPTEPNSLPLPPALVWSRTVSAASALAASRASSRPRMSRAARARLIRSICFSAPHGQPAWHQVVPAVPAGHLHHVAGGAQAGDLLGEDELHRRATHRVDPLARPSGGYWCRAASPS